MRGFRVKTLIILGRAVILGMTLGIAGHRGGVMGVGILAVVEILVGAAIFDLESHGDEGKIFFRKREIYGRNKLWKLND